MITAIVARLRECHRDLEVAAITATELARDAALRLGFQSIPAWSGWMEGDIKLVDSFDPHLMVVIGADVMDGYYNPVTTARLLAFAECAARRGTKVAFSGFSFNSSPSSLLRPVFNNLSPSVAVNVRDRISRGRFQRFSRIESHLVADAAFMLEPDDSSDAVRHVMAWADRQRAAGMIVLGFNLHPMLITKATPAQVEGLVASAIEALRQVIRAKRVALLLLSHDYRGEEGDDACLGPIAKALQEELGERQMYSTRQYSASELKAMAGAADGVVTGRMHLAIATLGTGKPVAAMTYQDKFQGLFAHFNYPERFLLPPADAVDPQKLASLINDFIDRLPALTGQVNAQLPSVKKASELNMQQLTGAPQ
ncbi:polysaccharide pyruvyl transferase family protein [Pseudorhodoferax sp. Leaf274]|uniref:polysaccharide pyruvyl transferase family protein n=1 Tax=Pseudorhodoferax sp. Leaf274 TaxID=1736318 RepID=UPI00138EF26A